MTGDAVVTLCVLVLVLGLLMFTRRAPDAILWSGLGLLVVAPVPSTEGWRVGVLSVEQAFAGLANEGVITIGLLFVVAAALRDTGGLNWLAGFALGRPSTLWAAQNRIVWPTAVASGFINNTPLVAMLLPVIDQWSKRQSLSASKLLMPLSYASILGGACTLIGTSTNLIVNGWLISETDHPGLGMFDIAWVGVPVAVVGCTYILVAYRWLLPERKPPLDLGADLRRYTVEMVVEPSSELAGKTVEEAGLRSLPGLYLIEIDRDEELVSAVSRDTRLKENDRLVFAGVIDSVVDLQAIRGLRPATDQVFKFSEKRTNRILVEAVISNSSPFNGHTVREGRFRTLYNAAVIAVARNGAQIRRKIGDIRLRAGDTLLLEARPSFLEQQRNRRDFYLVSAISGSPPIQHHRAWISISVLVLMVMLVALNVLSMLKAALIAAGLMLITRCVNASTARRAVDLPVLLVIAAALGLGKAMQVSGLAGILGELLRDSVGNSPTAMLAAIYGLTMVLAGVITAKAAALLVLPIALVAAADLGVSYMPFVIAVMVASATTVATPIGYPTNLMVLGPGGYRFTDYLFFGGPLSLLIWFLAVSVIPLFWPIA